MKQSAGRRRSIGIVMPFTTKTLLLSALVVFGLAAMLLHSSVPQNSGKPTVVVYTSVDDELALPLFKRFTEETGITVIPRTDSEASKTTGLAGRLLQLKNNPDGDVFWNSELSLTQMLAKNGVLEPYVSPQAQAIPDAFKDANNFWTGFGCRARVLIYNTGRVSRDQVPRSLDQLADPRWRGRFVIAKPLFGTTRSHLVSFALALGEEQAFQIFRRWRENGLVLAESNSDVRNLVEKGIKDIGLTDSDDVFSAMDRNKPVDFIIPDQCPEWMGAYLIPNTVAVLKNGPHPQQAHTFVNYLLRPETEAWLSAQSSHQIPVRPGISCDSRLRNLKQAPVDIKQLGESVLPLGEKIYRILCGEE